MQKYALPNINNFAALAHGCKWFSALDVGDAYHSIPVNPDHRHKLTVTIPLGELLPQSPAHGPCVQFMLLPAADERSRGQYFPCLLLSGRYNIHDKRFGRALTNSASSLCSFKGPWFGCQSSKVRCSRPKSILFRLSYFFWRIRSSPN